MKRTKLNYTIYCKDCIIECIATENGILCPSCGADITDEELDDEDI